MKKVLFYAMSKEKMCFMHILLNALDLKNSGQEAKIIFEGMSVLLVGELEKEQNPLYLKAKEAGLIAGICFACSKGLGVYEENEKAGLPFLKDMSGHAGMKSYLLEGYEVVSM